MENPTDWDREDEDLKLDLGNRLDRHAEFLRTRLGEMVRDAEGKAGYRKYYQRIADWANTEPDDDFKDSLTHAGIKAFALKYDMAGPLEVAVHYYKEIAQPTSPWIQKRGYIMTALCKADHDAFDKLGIEV